MDEKRVREALVASARRTAVGRLRPRRASRAARSGQPASTELNSLLERHRPLLQYDSLEGFRADSVASICELVAGGRCNALRRADGALIAAAAGGGEARLDLDFLRGPTYPNGEPAYGGDYLDECGGSPAGDALAMRRRRGGGDLVYGRARRDGEGRLWLQYWFFYYYDDKGLLGLEQHEGDWEMVQFRLGEEMAPDAATFARHAGAERLSWDQVERAGGGEGPAVVYPARGSHASLPRPGSFEAPAVPDHNDGLGPRLRPALVPIADDGPGWVLWPGRWGSTRRREFFEGDSPRGPREQPPWWDPAELHREARPWQGTAGGGDPAPQPQLTARREGDLAIVSYRFGVPREGEGEPARVVVAPFALDDSDPSGPQALPIEGRKGSFAIQLPTERDWVGVRVSVASDRGVAGETVAAKFG